ncbi:MAG: hypothetical protein JO202_02300 [Ktedonobacteraceae bacterium]|nr:hypothetical protein [Ktedonobacteraceae bacterium]
MNEQKYEVYVKLTPASTWWDIEGSRQIAPSALEAVCRLMQKKTLTWVFVVQVWVVCEPRETALYLKDVARIGDELKYAEREGYER